VAATLPWVHSPAYALSVEERATVEPFHSGALKFPRDGRTPVSDDDDVEH
jgi:hypothetical protein